MLQNQQMCSFNMFGVILGFHLPSFFIMTKCLSFLCWSNKFKPSTKPFIIDIRYHHIFRLAIEFKFTWKKKEI